MSFYTGGAAVLPGPAALEASPAGFVSFPPEEQAFLNELAVACGDFGFEFQVLGAQFGINSGNGSGSSSAISFPRAVGPQTQIQTQTQAQAQAQTQTQTPSQLHKRRRSAIATDAVADADAQADHPMHHLFGSQPSWQSEKLPACQSADAYDDGLGCLDEFDRTSCLPASTIESWRQFCSRYPTVWGGGHHGTHPVGPLPEGEGTHLLTRHHPPLLHTSQYGYHDQPPPEADDDDGPVDANHLFPRTISHPPRPMAMIASPPRPLYAGDDDCISRPPHAPDLAEPAYIVPIHAQPPTENLRALAAGQHHPVGASDAPPLYALPPIPHQQDAPAAKPIGVPRLLDQALIQGAAPSDARTAHPYYPTFAVTAPDSAAFSVPATAGLESVDPTPIAPAADTPPLHHSELWEPAPGPRDTSLALCLLTRGTQATTKPKYTQLRRGPFKDTASRQKTAQTRKMGSCIRCKMQRIRCEFDPNTDGPCLTCLKVSSGKIWRLPCLRYKVTDIKLNKPGQVPGFEWTQRWSGNSTNAADNISKWASSETRLIQVSDGNLKRPLQLCVRRFVPQPGDKLARTWVWNGIRKSVSVPPYAVINLESIEDGYVGFIETGIIDCINSVVGSGAGLLGQTYAKAYKFARDPSTREDERELLMLALRLWVAVRLGSRSTVIVGDDTLGMPHDILDETSPIGGAIPVPPVMGAQLDMVLNQHLVQRLRKDLLARLQRLSQAAQTRNWMVTYLIFFILLHNASLLTRHDESYAQKHGMRKRWAREETVREYHLGANILLAYFHYCNKGIYPFSTQCKDEELKMLAQLNDEMLDFVRYTRVEAERHADEWAEVRHSGNYSHDLFFLSQMFELQWRPASTTV